MYIIKISIEKPVHFTGMEKEGQKREGEMVDFKTK